MTIFDRPEGSQRTEFAMLKGCPSWAGERPGLLADAGSWPLGGQYSHGRQPALAGCVPFAGFR
jgi:hypothetical protein